MLRSPASNFAGPVRSRAPSSQVGISPSTGSESIRVSSSRVSKPWATPMSISSIDRRERCAVNCSFPSPVEQLVQIVGAILILVAFAGAQFGRLDQRSVAYLVLNLIGSLILAVLAAIESQLGFLLLEGVWSLVSLWSLVAELRAKPATG